MRGFFAGDGRLLVAVEPGGRVSLAVRDGTSLLAGNVADAALLHLSRGHARRPHVVWIGRGGIGFAALDSRASAPVMMALPGRGGAARAAAATRLAVAEGGAGKPLILVGHRGGGVTALAVSDRYGNIRLETAGHWSVGGDVRAIAARGQRVRIIAATGVWSLHLDAAEPAPVREADRARQAGR